MKITDLMIDPRSLGEKLWLVDVSPAYEYKDNRRTDTVLGYRYAVAMPEKGLDKINESIDELNHLACVLSELDEDELAKFEAVMDSGEYTGSVKDLINLAQNLDSYNFYPDIHSEEDLGRMYIQELEAVQVPEHLIDYIDYEAYGRDVRINEGGHFAPGGYVVGDNSFTEHYHGIEDIPDEQRVFSMPNLPIREQMAAYQEMAGRAAPPAERPAPRVDREER